jgi:hypothetical protein
VRFHTLCCILWRVPEQGNVPSDAGWLRYKYAVLGDIVIRYVY